MIPLCDQPVKRKPQKNQTKNYGPRSAQTIFFIKFKISGTPKLCWTGQVKFEFQGHFKGQEGQKCKNA